MRESQSPARQDFSKAWSGRLPALHQSPSKHMCQCFNCEFDKHERLGDQVCSSAQAALRPALEVRQACHKNDGCRLVGGKPADLCAEFKTIHSRHLDIQEDQVVNVLSCEF